MAKIRFLEKKDAASVAALIPQLTKNIVEPENLVSRLEKLAVGNNYQYFIAELDGKVVGLAGLAWYAVPSKGLIGWIEEVVVDQAARGHGLGRALMEELVNFSKIKGCKKIKLTTNNPIAQKLYQDLGFIDAEQKYLCKTL
ncbi:MAG: GNAT family N-acetyltransferase [Candidatus Komeilibacteria bacterium]|nr:GNAT family N-acetyltransferase [Candidatus Komeilibacteria bacterium]